MGQHFLAILGALAVDKRREEWLLTISIAFLLLDCQDVNLNKTYNPKSVRKYTIYMLKWGWDTKMT